MSDMLKIAQNASAEPNKLGQNLADHTEASTSRHGVPPRSFTISILFIRHGLGGPTRGNLIA